MTDLYWRGVRICACMKAPLDELARITGSDFKVTPIPGFGSYQDGTTDSGSVATGGGHIDIYLTGYSSTTKKRVEALARMIGFYADIREPKWYSPYFGKWISKSWASHLHMILKDCSHLSSGAKAQLAEWYAGENGLAGEDVDDGPREYLRQTWEQYLATREAIATPAPAEVLWADYSWGRPDVTKYPGVMRYLETGTTRPDLTVDEVKALHSKGKSVGLIWETSAAAATQGRTLGLEHARRANLAADQLGAPKSAAIFYTVDSDVDPSQVAAYFDGVRAVTGRPVGIYGSYRIVEWAAAQGIAWRWQTKAWSAGKVSSNAHLYQRDFLTSIDLNVLRKPFPAWAPATTATRTWTVSKGQTLGGIAAALGVTLTVLLSVNPQIKDPNVIQPGQVITVPPAATIPAPKPTINPAPAPTAVAPKPAPQPVTRTVTLSAAAVSKLYPGARNTTVTAYERALAKAGVLSSRYVDGYYGTATSAATKSMYAKLARKQPNAGWTPRATRPGPGLLHLLNVGYAAKAATNPAPRSVARVDASKLRAQVSSRHVTAYQRALRAYLGSATANRLNPAGATGYYGGQTEAMTRAAYRKLGWLSGDIRYPGPGLLRVLGL